MTNEAGEVVLGDGSVVPDIHSDVDHPPAGPPPLVHVPMEQPRPAVGGPVLDVPVVVVAVTRYGK